MRNSLIDIFDQAELDTFSITTNGKGYKAISLYGIKIIKDSKTSEVVVFNTMIGGNHYKELKGTELEIFLNNSWRYGVYTLSLSNFRLKLNRIEDRIKAEVNGRGSKKRLALLKSNREEVLRKYTEVNKKINKL